MSRLKKERRDNLDSQEVDFLISSQISAGGAQGFPPAYDYRDHLPGIHFFLNGPGKSVSTKPRAILYQKPRALEEPGFRE